MIESLHPLDGQSTLYNRSAGVRDGGDDIGSEYVRNVIVRSYANYHIIYHASSAVGGTIETYVDALFDRRNGCGTMCALGEEYCDLSTGVW